jgi:phenylacetate-CoA ligase
MYDPKTETMPREEMRKLKDERLRATVRHIYDNVKFYRERMEARGISPDDIRGMDDLPKLPFMEKDDYREQYPFGMLGVPMGDIVRIHASSGTTGKPKVAAYTRGDLEVWAECTARSLGCGGVTKNDMVQVAYGYGLFTGGLGLHDGAARLGAAVVPASSGNTEKQVALIQDFKVDALCCTPSYALQIAEVAEKMGVDMRKLPLRVGFFGAEPWTEAMRLSIEERLGIRAHDIYGLTEVSGPGVGCSCEAQDGIHIFDDHFHPEIVDPETGEPLPDGEKGELVFTCLTKRGMPVIRYRTHDLTRLYPLSEKCACGRTFRRIERLQGRTDDMLIVRGINVFPSQVEDVLVRIKGVLPQYLIVVDRKGNLDTMEIKVEIQEHYFSDEVRKIEALRDEIQHQIKSILNLKAKITLVEPGGLGRSLGKAKRAQDLRKLV